MATIKIMTRGGTSRRQHSQVTSMTNKNAYNWDKRSFMKADTQIIKQANAPHG